MLGRHTHTHTTLYVYFICVLGYRQTPLMYLLRTFSCVIAGIWKNL